MLLTHTPFLLSQAVTYSAHTAAAGAMSHNVSIMHQVSRNVSECSLRGGVLLHQRVGCALLVMLSVLLAAACSGSGELLYFTSDRDGNLDIYSVDPGEGTETNLTRTSDMDETSSRVSPNGKSVAFVSRSGDEAAVEVMRSDGSDRTLLSPRSGVQVGPRWSPDSGRLAYVDREAGPSIVVAAADGTERAQLTTLPGDDLGDWSDDGEAVAFTVMEGADRGIYTRNPDGVNEVRLTDKPDYSPVWAPRFRRIAFLSTRDDNPEIYLMDADGSNIVRLTRTGAAEYDISWSPDGRKLLFVSERHGNPEIYVQDPDDAEPTRLTRNNARDIQPVWSPDGERIAFVSYLYGNAEIFVMDADGANQVRVTNNPAEDTSPAW